MSIAKNLVALAEMENKKIALEEAQKLQSALESLTCIGDSRELKAACILLHSVNEGFDEILEVKALIC